MKPLSIFLLFVSGIICKAPDTVYLCNSGNAKKYHLNAKCRGLSNCQYKIIQSSLEKAKKDGKTLCGWEK